MAKICVLDDEKIGMMTGSVALADGSHVCSKHWKQMGFKGATDAQLLNSNDVKKIYEESIDGPSYVSNLSGFGVPFEYDKQQSNGDYLHVSPSNKQLQIGGTGFKFKPKVQIGYEDLISYNVVEDGDQITGKGGVGRAIGGGLLFGPVGAIVGGVTGKKKAKKVVNDLHIDVVVANRPKDVYTIEIFSTETKPGLILKLGRQAVVEMTAFFDKILLENEQAKQSSDNVAVQASDSAADEIRKFKSLLDDGIISKEEFNAKKKELLGL